MLGKYWSQEEQELNKKRKRLQKHKANNEKEKGNKLINLTECAILEVRTF